MVQNKYLQELCRFRYAGHNLAQSVSILWSHIPSYITSLSKQSPRVLEGLPTQGCRRRGRARRRSSSASCARWGVRHEPDPDVLILGGPLMHVESDCACQDYSAVCVHMHIYVYIQMYIWIHMCIHVCIYSSGSSSSSRRQPCSYVVGALDYSAKISSAPANECVV